LQGVHHHAREGGGDAHAHDQASGGHADHQRRGRGREP
jgi:hypothetical protein